MAKIVRNPLGGVHSVPDDFELPEGWEELSEADAPAYLLGTEPDAQVTAVQSHDGGGIIPEQPSIDHVGDGPVPEAAPVEGEVAQ